MEMAQSLFVSEFCSINKRKSVYDQEVSLPQTTYPLLHCKEMTKKTDTHMITIIGMAVEIERTKHKIITHNGSNNKL